MTAQRPGKLIAFEGIDRAGKSSMLPLLERRLVAAGASVRVCGEFASPLAESLRAMLREGGSPFVKTYWFAADRAWTYERVCLPALARGELVLWDRYVDSALAYRAADLAGGTNGPIGLDFVDVINRPFRMPDLTVYLDIPEQASTERARAAGKAEPYDEAFLRDVRARYLELAGRRGYAVVAATGERDEVVSEVESLIRSRFTEFFA